MEYNLDAKKEKLGRIATQAAVFLMGKNRTDFQRNTVADAKVKISNVSHLDISEKKKNQKEYNSYSGYPGGRKTEMMEKIIRRKGYSEIMRKAIYNMLPSNKLRAKLMKNLTITE